LPAAPCWSAACRAACRAAAPRRRWRRAPAAAPRRARIRRCHMGQLPQGRADAGLGGEGQQEGQPPEGRDLAEMMVPEARREDRHQGDGQQDAGEGQRPEQAQPLPSMPAAAAGQGSRSRARGRARTPQPLPEIAGRVNRGWGLRVTLPLPMTEPPSFGVPIPWKCPASAASPPRAPMCGRR
jgi:hypothetical protein